MSPGSLKQSPPSDEPTWPADPVLEKAASLAETLAADWQRGHRRPAEEYLALLGDFSVGKHGQAVLRIIYEEVCQRQELGQEVSLTELQQRFPQWAEELALVYNCHRVLGLVPRGPRFPGVGDTLGDFRVVAELGRGGRGRVYLAEQTFLAGRLMILKVIPSRDQEHLKLARLQHTHIVPLYAVRDFPERNLRKLCMPCLGGATLEKLLAHLLPIAPEKRTGRDLLEALRTSSTEGHPRMFWPAQGPNRRFLEGASFVQAVCWMGVCLADALHYAHGQGLVHLDVKPSNVLLTADCQPMLLDFHLAHGPVVPEEEAVWPGGTPAYMSPEQLAAWRAYSNQQPLPMAVDARSDLYSLGALLREALYGESRPTDGTSAPAPLSLPPRAHLSRGLRDILARCLHPDPELRYANAALLAEDLRRHLTDRPLVGVGNRSLAERWSKWRRRRPQALALWLLLVVCFGAMTTLGALGVSQTVHRQRDAVETLEEGRRQVAQHHYAEAVATFDRGLDRLGEGTTGSPLATRLHQQRQRAARAQNIEALHQQVERSRYLPDDLLSVDTLRKWEALCHTVWGERSRLLATRDTALEPDLEEMVRRDLLDVAVLWADCRVRLEPDGEAARQDALRLLDEAETVFGPSLVLSRQRQALVRGKDATAPPGSATPHRDPHWAWEHYALGRWLLRSDDLEGAAAAFERAVELRPQDFWPWFGKGLCAQRRQRYEEAETAFSVCVALAPDSAACYYNRALALAAHGDAAAEKDYDRALALDPHLASATLNRGVLKLQKGRLDEAETDLNLAVAEGADPAGVHYNRALVYQARHDSRAALDCLAQALRHNPNHKGALDLQARLLSTLPANPRR